MDLNEVRRIIKEEKDRWCKEKGTEIQIRNYVRDRLDNEATDIILSALGIRRGYSGLEIRPNMESKIKDYMSKATEDMAAKWFSDNLENLPPLSAKDRSSLLRDYRHDLNMEIAEGLRDYASKKAAADVIELVEEACSKEMETKSGERKKR